MWHPCANEFYSALLTIQQFGTWHPCGTHDVVEARRLIVTLGRERWAQGTKELALAFGKSADTVAYIQRDGIRQRLEGGEFSRRYESVDEDLIAGKVGDDRV